MKRIICALGLLVLALPAFASETPSLRPITSAQVAALQRGETIASVRVGEPNRGEVIGLIQAPVEDLGAILADFPNSPRWAPSTKNVRIVGSSPECTFVEGVTELPFPLRNRNWRMCSRTGFQVVDGVRSFVYQFDYVRGSGNLEESFGFWVLHPLADNPGWTYVRYVINADPGISLPQWLIAWATEKTLPDVIAGLRSRYQLLHGG